MNRKAFADDRNVALLIQANSSYDRHLKAMRSIYQKSHLSFDSNEKKFLTIPHLASRELHRRNKEQSFAKVQLSKFYSNLDNQSELNKQNTKILKTLKNISSRPRQAPQTAGHGENIMYQDNLFLAKLQKRKWNLQSLQSENTRLARGIQEK